MIFDQQTRARKRRGGTVVETAIALNLFLLLLLGVVEFGRLLMTRHLVNNAARAAARQASSGTADKSLVSIKQTALDLLTVQQFSATPAVLVYKADANGNNIGLWDDAAFGQGIAVQVDVDYRPLLPTFGIVPSTVHLRSKAIMRSEGD
jgi:Flp pilus assembly protein TadG